MTPHRPVSVRSRRTAIACAAALCLTAFSPSPVRAAGWEPLPVDAGFDYQIGGDYTPRRGVTVVSRDWFAGSALPGGYSICYVNAFQTQDDEPDVDRPDERSNWPRDLVLFALGDDPRWGGEYLVDISTPARRAAALAHVAPMVATCAAKGFDAVEYDNLDSWTRFDGTPVASRVPFGQSDAVAYAELLTDHAHGLGLAVGQKNTPQLGRVASLTTIGFDFAIAEECGFYRECASYRDVFGNRLVVIEYTATGFRRACTSVGRDVAVVRRDVNVSVPGRKAYRYQAC